MVVTTTTTSLAPMGKSGLVGEYSWGILRGNFLLHAFDWVCSGGGECGGASVNVVMVSVVVLMVRVVTVCMW